MKRTDELLNCEQVRAFWGEINCEDIGYLASIGFISKKTIDNKGHYSREDLEKMLQYTAAEKQEQHLTNKQGVERIAGVQLSPAVLRAMCKAGLVEDKGDGKYNIHNLNRFMQAKMSKEKFEQQMAVLRAMHRQGTKEQYKSFFEGMNKESVAFVAKFPHCCNACKSWQSAKPDDAKKRAAELPQMLQTSVLNLIMLLRHYEDKNFGIVDAYFLKDFLWYEYDKYLVRSDDDLGILASPAAEIAANAMVQICNKEIAAGDRSASEIVAEFAVKCGIANGFRGMVPPKKSVAFGIDLSTGNPVSAELRQRYHRITGVEILE